MRITNKIIQRNNLANINTNKIYQDSLSTQMSTQKKISRPSDDPVVAIRALRLRTNVTEITQYYSKNIPDADSWLSITEDALKNLSDVVTNMIGQCTKGANGDLTSSDREVIIEQMKALSDEIYVTGDADYAGRFVFTGYRTDTSLSYPADENKLYTITEQLGVEDLDALTHVNMGQVLDITSSNYQNIDVTEENVEAVEVYRFRLAYDDCQEDYTPSISFQKRTQDPTTGADVYTDVTWPENNGDMQIVHSYDDPYGKAAGDPDALVYVPETGEILLGANRLADLQSVKDAPETVADEGEIRVTYQKSEWLKGDLRPEHYFYCESGDIKYNPSYLEEEPVKQVIEYDVGFNQTIQVNSSAEECFKHNIGREVDDLVNTMQEVVDLEKVVANLEGLIENATGADKKKLETQLDAANKALTLSKDKSQKLFENGITVFQNALDQTNLSLTNVGTSSSKLALIKSRMQNQKTTFETLKSENEDVDITEVAIELSSAGLTYEAALMATGKVMKNTLLNFI